MKNLLLAVLLTLAVAIGVAAVFAGQADDSPGLGGLGLVLAVAALTVGVRTVLRARRDAGGGASSGSAD